MSILDRIPLASLVAVASIVIVVIAYITDELNVQDALVALGAVLGGTGVVGIARAQSGKGVR